MVAAATVTFLTLSASVVTVGFVDLFRTEPIPAIWSMGFVTWGFFCCYSNRWIWGYLLFGFASLFQFLVGILPGVLMLPLLLASAYRDRRLKTLILLVLKLETNPSQAIRDLGWLGILWGCLMIPAIAEKLRSILAKWKRFSRPVTLLSYGMSMVPLLILILGLQEKLPPPLQNPFTGRISFTRNQIIHCSI